MQLWARLVPPVATTPAQPRKMKLLRKQKQQFDLPWRPRLKLVHPSWLIQRKRSRVMVEESGALHAISHARNDAVNRVPLRTLHSTCCKQSFACRRNANKKTVIFDPIPTVIKQYLNSLQNSNPTMTKFTNSNKNSKKKQYLNSINTVKIFLNTVQVLFFCHCFKQFQNSDYCLSAVLLLFVKW